VPAVHLINQEGFILSSNITPMNSLTGEDIVGTYACDHLHPACTEKFLLAIEECLKKGMSYCCVTLKTNDRWFAKMEKIRDNIVRVSEWNTEDYGIVKLWDVI
jgi:hypothetical protein